jgi:6,7-dimethyl-8-ribityllumazine synthase
VIYQAQKRQDNYDAIVIAATMAEDKTVHDTMLSAQTGRGMIDNLMQLDF